MALSCRLTNTCSCIQPLKCPALLNSYMADAMTHWTGLAATAYNCILHLNVQCTYDKYHCLFESRLPYKVRPLKPTKCQRSFPSCAPDTTCFRKKATHQRNITSSKMTALSIQLYSTSQFHCGVVWNVSLSCTWLLWLQYSQYWSTTYHCMYTLHVATWWLISKYRINSCSFLEMKIHTRWFNTFFEDHRRRDQQSEYMKTEFSKI